MMSSISHSTLLDALEEDDDEVNGKHKRPRLAQEKHMSDLLAIPKEAAISLADRSKSENNDKSLGSMKTIGRRPLRGATTGALMTSVSFNRLTPNLTSVRGSSELLINGAIPIKINTHLNAQRGIPEATKVCAKCRALTSKPICEHCKSKVETPAKSSVESPIHPFVTITKLGPITINNPSVIVRKDAKRYPPLEITKVGDRCRISPVKRLPSKLVVHGPPECLTLSSDDEADNAAADKDSPCSSENSSEEARITGENVDKDVCQVKDEIVTPYVEPKDGLVLGILACRSIRFGSYKCKAVNLKVTKEYFSVNVPSLVKDKVVTINLPFREISDFLAHFKNAMPVLAFKTTRTCASAIRNRLHLDSQSEQYYDPDSIHETQQRVVILPVKLSEECISSVTSYFAGKTSKAGRPILKEISFEAANTILLQTMSSDVKASLLQKVSKTPDAKKCRLSLDLSDSEAAQIMAMYPLPPLRGGITITKGDFYCLNHETCLNDAIIDFYLKYVYFEKLSEADRLRTYIFSSFFFKKLTNSRRLQKSASRSSVSCEDHCSRLKGWTKNVDLFEKDFIIIPINQRNHWFLAIICFPILAGQIVTDVSEEMINKSLEETPEQSEANGSVTDEERRLVSCEYDSDSSAETIKLSGSDFFTENTTPEDVEMRDIENETQATTAETAKDKEHHKIPCILIFDSLHSRSWSGVVNSLREYLTTEWQVKRQSPKVFDKETIKGAYPIVPQQNNYMDCGIYLLQYVESFFESPITDFRAPIRGLEDWFSEELIDGKRKNIQELIVKLSKKQSQRRNDVSVSKCQDVSKDTLSESDLNESKGDICEDSASQTSSTKLSETLPSSPVL